jgi:hypothetical protein
MNGLKKKMELEAGDICTIEVHKTLKSSLRHIPVMVVKKNPAKNKQV